MPYPDSEAVVAFASGYGIDLENSYEFTDDLAAIAKDFEARTHRRGFQSGDTATHTGDGPDWRSGCTWWIPDFSAVTEVAYDGTALVEDTDYILHRWQEDDEDTPYVAIEFLRCLGAKRRAYTVTGTKGFGDCPADVAAAFKRRALAGYLGAPIDGAAGQVKREKLGAQEVEYDTTSGRDSVSRMLGDYELAIAAYTRIL